MTQLSTEAERFFVRYRYPDWLATHSRVVGRIAAAFVAARRPGSEPIDEDAVVLAGYLHDVGRSPLLAGDARDHNVLSALVLAAEGLERCVEPARRHAIYAVLDPALAPRTFADKLVYVADRRGGQAVEPLEERARNTALRNPKYAAEIERAVPIARELEREVFANVTFASEDLARRVS
ncbi:MAG TPA: HD domain-containing protein [Candidatus Limnocylindria bacterium]|nr:HD domain-containing protein [Candidatus Limnocylindria bacterium]